MRQGLFQNLRHDLPASLVVFFVAVPLCLGIAIASGAPPLAGILAGIVGGIVVGMASGSPLGVSGPAAGLAVIVFTAIADLGSFSAFLLAVVIAGVFQMLLGFLKAGFIAYFFPSSVIKGMLTGIGLLIILKQIPHAIGFDKDSEGDFSFLQSDGQNTFSAIGQALELITPAAVIISLVSLAILIIWDKWLSKKHRVFQLLQGPIVVVILGILFFNFINSGNTNLTLSSEHLVQLPVITGLSSFVDQLTFPNFSMLGNIEIYKTAAILAIVASLETLLCVEATDKLDPYKRVTPANRELRAQGLGNMISGAIGGLPITQVIVRSSANITFGGKTKMSAILHGVFILISVLTIGNILNMIPLASLAAVLIVVGYKLAKPSLFKEMYKKGAEQFVPFMATVVAILLTDLLVGISVGLAFGIFFTLLHSYKNAYHMKDVVTTDDGREVHHLVLAEEVSFFNKASVLKALNNIPEGSRVVIDYSKSKAIAQDVLEIIEDFKTNSGTRDIKVETLRRKESVMRMELT